jgi:hypothetical protein
MILAIFLMGCMETTEGRLYVCSDESSRWNAVVNMGKGLQQQNGLFVYMSISVCVVLENIFPWPCV